MDVCRYIQSLSLVVAVFPMLTYQQCLLLVFLYTVNLEPVTGLKTFAIDFTRFCGFPTILALTFLVWEHQ